VSTGYKNEPPHMRKKWKECEGWGEGGNQTQCREYNKTALHQTFYGTIRRNIMKNKHGHENKWPKAKLCIRNKGE
jgi:hypothetical protein